MSHTRRRRYIGTPPTYPAPERFEDILAQVRSYPQAKRQRVRLDEGEIEQASDPYHVFNGVTYERS